jgi:hypothetical protein
MSIGTGSKAIYTIVARNYFAQALTLRESVIEHEPDARFVIVIVDRKDEGFLKSWPEVEVMWACDLGIGDFSRHALRFDVIELSTNVKPTVGKLLLQQHDLVLYIDPDIYLYEDLGTVWAMLEDSNAVVTPACLNPVLDGFRPDDLEFMRVGTFNLAFIGLKRSAETLRFLDWWESRCLQLGFMETQSGLFVDQKWITLAVGYFEGIRVSRHPGMNVAQWNLHERVLSLSDGRVMVNQSHPLVFMHFSSFDPDTPDLVAKRQNRFARGERPDFSLVSTHYAQRLLANGFHAMQGFDYGYDSFSDGSYESPTTRRLFCAMEADFQDRDPMDVGSEFYRFAVKHHLAGRSVVRGRRLIANDLKQLGREEAVIAFVLRLILRILGPNRYFNLMRYLAHISSIRAQTRLFAR